jgi:hypothetical protein
MTQPLDALVSKYESQPALKALIQLVPLVGLGSLNSLLQDRIKEMKIKRFEALIDELADGKATLNEENLKSDDFIYCFLKTVDATFKSRRLEKVRRFGRLLKTYASKIPIDGHDEYEEYLGILDELSEREFVTLSLLKKFEDDNPLKEAQNELQRATGFWDKFESEACSNLGLETIEFFPFLVRVGRTGLFEQFVGGYLDYVGGKGKTTMRFLKILKCIQHPK